jgi:drug/metabolite transporter (DMT)-like permease
MQTGPGAAPWRSFVRSHVPAGPGLLALLAVYVLWGTSFMAIRVAVLEIPPFLMSGTRFLAAAAILAPLGLFLEGRPHMPATTWVRYGIAGCIMFVGSSGLLAYGERSVPSGIASVLIATIPVWMVVIEVLRSRLRLTPDIFVGLAGGIVGVAILVRPDASRDLDLPACGAILLGAASWAFGSLWVPAEGHGAGPLTIAALQMGAGSAGLLVTSYLIGETAGFSPSTVSTSAVLALLWLVLPVGILTFSSFTYALRVWPAHVVAAYPFVNSVVAVALGWLLLSESVSFQQIAGMAVALAGAGMLAARTVMRRPDAEPENVSSPAKLPAVTP